MKKTYISFLMNEEKDITIDLLKDDNIVWTEDIRAAKGINQYCWDLVTEKVENQSAYYYNYLRFPEPGKYVLQIRGEELLLEAVLEIKER